MSEPDKTTEEKLVFLPSIFDLRAVSKKLSQTKHFPVGPKLSLQIVRADTIYCTLFKKLKKVSLLNIFSEFFILIYVFSWLINFSERFFYRTCLYDSFLFDRMQGRE